MRAVTLFGLLLIADLASAQTFPIPEQMWHQWMLQMETMPDDPPLHGCTHMPTGRLALPCTNPNAMSAGPNGQCYTSTSVLASTLTGVTITDQQRLDYLRYYVLRFNLSATPLNLQLQAFTDVPDGVNVIAARVRHQFYTIADMVQTSMNNFAPVNGIASLADSYRLAGESLKAQALRQAELLDRIFPDAAVWHLLLVSQNHLVYPSQAPPAVPMPPVGGTPTNCL